METAARGAVLLAEGRAEEALPVLLDACRRWHELGAAYNAASTCVLLARAYRMLGDEASADAEDAQAEATYERLGAHHHGQRPPDGLSWRECEVLALVAEAPILLKMFVRCRATVRSLMKSVSPICRFGVSHSRTQAARYAVDHGLTAAR